MGCLASRMLSLQGFSLGDEWPYLLFSHVFARSFKLLLGKVFTLIPKEALKGLLVSRLCPAKSQWENILKLPVSVFQGDLTGWIPNCFFKNLGNFVLR